MNMSNIEPHGTYSIIDIYIYIYMFLRKIFLRISFFRTIQLSTTSYSHKRSTADSFGALDIFGPTKPCRLPWRIASEKNVCQFKHLEWFFIGSLVYHDKPSFFRKPSFSTFFLVFHGFFIDPSFFMSEKSSKERSGGPSSQAFSHHPSY